jgi:ATP-dependent exoDNAse (exonuclease V) beta subunit
VVQEDEGGAGLFLLRLDKKYAQLSDRILKAWREEYKKEFIDELNTIYVALTRARYELYIFIPHGIRVINNIAWLLIPHGFLQSGRPTVRQEGKIEEGATSLLIPSPKYRKWMDLLKEEFFDESAVRNRKNILRGKILHEILAAVGNLAEQNYEQAIKKGFSQAANAFPAVSDFSEFEPIIRRVLETQTLSRFFCVPDAQVVQEKEVVDSFGITKRIDRLIIKEKEVWIVDYKSKEDPSIDYREQLLAYKAVIQELYPAGAVKCFLIYLEELKVEEVYG